MEETATTTQASSPLPQIDHDLHCYQCEYNLRGLAVEGNCPECGARVERSAALHAQILASGYLPLRLTSRRRLRQLSLACLLIVGGAVVHLIAVMWTLQLSFAFSSGTPDPWPRSIWHFYTVVWWIPALGLVVAMWLLTAREPQAATSRLHRRASTTLRGAGLFLVVPDVLGSLTGWNILRIGQAFFEVTRIVEPFVVAGITALAWLLLARLARRGARPRLRLAAICLAWMLPIQMILQWFFLNQMAVRSSTFWGFSSQPMVGTDLAIVLLPYRLIEMSFEFSDIFWIAIVGLSLMSCCLLVMFWRMFRSCAKESSAKGAA